MRKQFLLTMLLACGLGSASAQTVMDFESPFTGSKGTNGQPDYQVGGDDFQIVDNPSKAGINTSGKVGRFTRKVTGNWWAHAWFEFPNIDITATRNAPKYLHVKVYKPIVSSVCVQMKDKKDEPAFDTSEMINKKQTKQNEWQDVVFKLTASGSYCYLEVKPDFEDYEVGTRLDSDIQIYFDDIVINDDPTGVGETPEPVITFEGTLPENFEGENTLLDSRFYGENYGTFGNNEIEPQYISVVENPYIDDVNTTDNCAKFVRRVTGEWWAGAWMLPKDDIVIDTANKYFHVFVYKTMESPVYLKLEGNNIGTGDVLAMNSGDKTDEWVDYVFEIAEDKYGTYNKINFMPDFVQDMSPADRFIKDQIIYFDELVLNGDAAPRTVATTSINSANVETQKVWMDKSNNLHIADGATMLDLYTIDGRLVKRVNVSGQSVNLSDMGRGIYIVKVKGQDNKMSVSKIRVW